MVDDFVSIIANIRTGANTTDIFLLKLLNNDETDQECL